jgi:polyphenol oxidase
MSQRQGGLSAPPFDSFNLGDHVGDDAAHVQANRQLWVQSTAPSPVFLKQVHGVAVAALTATSAQARAPIEADACWTDQPGVVCTMMVADCLPILLAAADGQSVAAVHAGWRGLAGLPLPVGGQATTKPLGVLEALCAQWPAAAHQANRAQMVVWLGPCIGPESFEVGPEVRAAFMAAAQSASDEQAIGACFVEQTGQVAGAPTKYLAHLSALARWRLQRLGFERVTGNDGTAAWCTVANPSRFFSHRRDAAVLGSTGRMAAGIWRL